MKAYLLASLLAVMLSSVLAKDDVHCFKADPHRDAVVKECKKETDAESQWFCFMRKMEVVVDDELHFSRLNNIIDKFVVVEKREQLKDLVNECMPKYSGASADKVKAFYQCYGPKFTQKICPLGL